MKRNSTFQPKRWLLLLFWLCSAAVMAQNISGKVTDENGQTMPGVSITLKGTSTGTTTQTDGTFKITASATSTLVFSFVGYTQQEVAVGNQTKIDVSLKLDDNALDEVVVVGYGTQKKKDLTGSIASADLVAFKESPNVSILQSLKGSLPGLTIGQTNRAGDEASINIRGTSTLSR